MLIFFIYTFIYLIFTFSNANELVKKFENQDFLELNKNFNSYKNYYFDLDFSKRKPSQIEFCKDEFLNEEIIDSFNEEIALVNIYYNDLMANIAELHALCNKDKYLSHYGYKVSLKSIENIKKSIEIQESALEEKILNKQISLEDQSYATKILNLFYYQRIAFMYWDMAIMNMSINPDKCHEDILFTLQFTKATNNDPTSSLKKSIAVKKLEAWCSILKLNYTSAVESLDFVNFKYQKLLEEFSKDDEIMDILIDYIHLSFLNSEPFDFKKVNKILDQNRLLQKLIKKLPNNKVYEKLRLLNFNIFWLKLAYYSQPLTWTYEEEIENAYLQITKQLNDPSLKKNISKIMYDGFVTEVETYKKTYALISNKVDNLLASSNNNNYLEQAKNSQNQTSKKDYEDFIFNLSASVLGNKKFFNENSSSQGMDFMNDEMLKKIRSEGDKVLKKYKSEIKKYDFLNSDPIYLSYNQLIIGLIELFSSDNKNALKKILKSYQNPFFKNNEYFAAYMTKHLEPIILAFGGHDKNELVNFLLFSETSREDFNLSRVIDLAKIKDNNLKKINANLEKNKKEYQILIRNVSNEDRESFQNKLSHVEKKIISIKKEIGKKYPNINLFESDYELYPSDFFSLLKKNEAIIKYFNYEFNNITSNLAVLIKKNSLDVFILPSQANLKLKVREYLKALSDWKTYDFELSRSIFKILFEPLKQKLNGIEKVIIIRDDKFNNLPFHTLVSEKKIKNIEENFKSNVDPQLNSKTNTRGVKISKNDSFKNIDLLDTKWLIDDFSISYLPSLKSFGVLRKQKQSNVYDIKFVGFGNPQISGGRDCYKTFSLSKFFRGSHTIDDLNEFCPLPETEHEIKLMNQNLKSQNNLIFTKDEANEINFKKLNNSSIEVLTIASHGVVSGGLNGLTESALLMTPPGKIKGDDDGLLKADEIAMTNINSKLVILSACNTAVESEKNSFKSLPMSFFYAGAKNILVSGWPVETKSALKLTSELIRKYQNDNKKISFALRDSIIELKKNNKYSHPYFWGAFSLYGD